MSLLDGCDVLRFRMYKGNDRILNFEVTNEEGVAIGIDDADEATFAMFNAETDEQVLSLTLAAGITLAGNIVTVTIPRADSDDFSLGEHLFELEIIDADGYLQTLAQGTAQVLRRLIS